MALNALVEQLAAALIARQQMLATAESCTGGWVAKLCTDQAGSSAWFDRSMVTYSNAAKQDMLGVKALTLAQYGAVSEAVAAEMVQGCLQNSAADIALAISGIAGPSGGSVEKPVGTVCFAWANTVGKTVLQTCHFSGNREDVRLQAVTHALRGTLELL